MFAKLHVGYPYEFSSYAIFIFRSVIDVSYMYGTPDMDMLLNFASNDDGAKV